MSDRPKRILFLSPTSSMGGAEVVLLSIAQHINRKKFSCLLVTQEEGSLTRAFRATGGWVFCQPLPAWRKFRNFFSRYRAARRLCTFAREQKIDLIHCNNYRLTPYALEVARACRIPCVTHLHDLLGNKHIRKFCLPKSSCLLAVSQYTAQPFKKYKVPVKVIYNGIPTREFVDALPMLRKEFGFTTDKQLIGIVGTFTEKKRHGLFLEIAAQIKPLLPEARFLIVGEDLWNTTVSKYNLQQQIKSLNIEEEAVFVGWRDDVPQVMSSLDVLLLPSTSEPFPLVVLEAMAAGAIVFAHKNCGGPAEAITDGQEGFLVDCENTQACARKVVEILADPIECTAVREAARQKVTQNFDMAGFISNIENFYNEIISE